MLVLYETAAGFAIFKILDEKKLKKVDNLFEHFETPEAANKIVQLQTFKKFADSAESLDAGLKCNEGKVCKPLRKMLKKVFEDVQEELMVWDPKLGSSIKEKLGIQVTSSGVVGELMRCIKTQVDGLIPDLQDKELSAMSLGLAHNLARYKLKFSPDKVDTMIVQAVSLLDDLDKEMNNYVMRAREWFGWHFPELTKILTDNVAYIKVVLAMGTREKAIDTDFSHIIDEELEQKVKEAAEVSMGTEMAEDDVTHVLCLCEQILEISEYRAQLWEYLKNRMQAIAPNLNILVGELVGARLISHAGSLLNLAKHPASTVQILGAEKALFRALKDRSSTPKYGLIYHAQMVGQCSVKNKGKMSRMLAAKAALAIRYDALGEDTNLDLGMNTRAKLASRLTAMESGQNRRISGLGKSQFKTAPHEYGTKEPTVYNTAADSTASTSNKRKLEDAEDSQPKKKTKKIKVELDNSTNNFTVEESTPVNGEKKKKKKKKRESEAMETTSPPKEEEKVVSPLKKEKKKKRESEAMETASPSKDEEKVVSPLKKEKKKKKKNKEKDMEIED